MSKADQTTMHHDHVLWNSDIEMWHQDVSIWKQELEALKNAMISIELTIENHEKSIDAHLMTIDEHRKRLAKHDLDLALISPGSRSDMELADSHEDERGRHSIQKEAHERLKKYHHQTMVHVKSLKKALDDAM